MRLWSLHPSHLDAKGLVALWREGLLAQKVLLGQAKGYRAHPQLERFRADPDPVAAIGSYLWAVHAEASRRGYRFDATKIVVAVADVAEVPLMTVTAGQLAYEWAHLQAKLERRSPEVYARNQARRPEAHPRFTVVPGEVEPWERR